MKTNNVLGRHFEFYFPNLDTLLRVEVEDGDVTVRATRDTFSPRRKVCFVRELVAEGFIPDEYHWFPIEEPQLYHRGVHWLVDFSWLKIDAAFIARVRRRMIMFLGFAYVFTVLLVGLAATGRLGNSLPKPAFAPSPSHSLTAVSARGSSGAL